MGFENDIYQHADKLRRVFAFNENEKPEAESQNTVTENLDV